MNESIWCDKCLRELSANLSDEARKVLDALPDTKVGARRKVDLSYALMNKTFVELEVLGLVTYEERGRGKFYTPRGLDEITRSGEVITKETKEGCGEFELEELLRMDEYHSFNVVQTPSGLQRFISKLPKPI